MSLPSDVNEGINQALALTSGADAIKAPVETAGNEGVGGYADSVRVSGQHGLCCSAGSQISQVASPESSTAQTGKSGTDTTASVEVPAIPLESLAKYSDEGENGWNAWGRAQIARKMNRIAAGGYNSVDRLIDTVEELAEVGQ